MKEGLRSGKLSVVAESGEGSKAESGDREASGSGGVKDVVLALGGTEPENELLDNGEIGKDGCDEGRKDFGLADNGRKRKRVNGGIGNDDSGKKKLKVEDSGEWQIVRRVLRSSSLMNGGGDKAKDEGEDALDVVASGGDDSENKLAEEKEETRDQLVSEPGKSPKRKRGRPPLVKKEESSGSELKKKKMEESSGSKLNTMEESSGSKLNTTEESSGSKLNITEESIGIELMKMEESSGRELMKMGESSGRELKKMEENSGSELKKKEESSGSELKKSKGKRGRPRKIQNDGLDVSKPNGGSRKKLKGKRGRPPKLQQNNVALKLKLGQPLKELQRDGALKRKRGRPPKVQQSNGDLKLKKPKVQQSNGDLKLKKPKVQQSNGDLKLKKPKVQQSNGDLKLKKRGRGRPRKVDKEEHNQLVFNGVSNGRKRKKFKRKPGRRPKVQESNKDYEGVTDKEVEVNVEDNKCLKLQDESNGDSEGVSSKQGELNVEENKSLKLQDGSKLDCEGVVNKEGELSAEEKRGSTLQDKTEQNVPASFSSCKRKRIGQKLNKTRFSSAKKNEDGADLESKENVALSMERSGTVNAVTVKKQKKTTKKDGEVEPARKSLRQSVSNKIVDLLLSAGWTIERRPRINKEYLDAVYVSPGGKTHWSVTLAYKILKKHYEEGNPESMFFKAGFIFTPIPEEELSVLKRVQIKKREGKKKLKREDGKGGNTSSEGAVREKKQKKKLVGKSVKGRTKGTKMKKGKRCALLARNSMQETDSNGDGYIPYNGKRTVLSWMIDLGTIPLNAKVQYMNQRKTKVLLEGRITRDGVHCDCCNETITISKFENHAGSKLCQPFRDISLESGTPLLQCLLDSWCKQQESEREGFHSVDVSEDPNDDTCGICGDGGDLICCDGCPSTFHPSCLDIKNSPGDWHCVFCSCKFCGMVCGTECQQDDADADLTASKLLACQLCEEKYHPFCSQSKDASYRYSSGSSFCGNKCQELFKKLKKLIGVRHDLEEGFSWTLIRRSDVGSNISLCDLPQHCDVAQKIECNSKLAVALFVMDECFQPIVDQRSGVNQIHNVVYNVGSNFNRLNHSGFFTINLERGDEIISAASIRIHGNQLAEMPFIGTRSMYRRQGMCRRLLNAVETALCSLDVERLVIPAISELKETWTSKFGFRPIEVSRKQEMKNMNIMVFPGIEMLHKPILKSHFADENTNVLNDSVTTEHMASQTKLDLLSNADFDVSGEVEESLEPKIAGEPAVESSLLLPDGSLNDTERKCLVELGMAHDNIEVEGKDKNTINPVGSTPNDERLLNEADLDVSGEVDANLGPEIISRPTVEFDLQLPNGSSNHTGMAIDNMEGKQKTITNPPGSTCGLPEQTEESSEYQTASSGSTSPVLVEKAIELDSQLNKQSAFKEELPYIEAEVTHSSGPVICSSIEDTECADSKVNLLDCVVTNNLEPHGESSTHQSTEQISAFELKASGEMIVCHDSAGNGVRKTREHYPEEKVTAINEKEVDHVAVQHESAALDEICPKFTKCCDSQGQPTRKILADVHPILHQKAEDDSMAAVQALLLVDSNLSSVQGADVHPILHQKAEDDSMALPVDSNQSCVQGNGLETPKVLSLFSS
ncbi:hypothetical protein UlMin_031445 [Ulmus minor]